MKFGNVKTSEEASSACPGLWISQN